MAFIILIWPLVIFVTLSLYGLILLTLPFSTTAATVFLFTLIAFWSRLPGVGIPVPFLILYLADIIDLMAMIVAINLGGIYGAFLSIFASVIGRACGAFTQWTVTMREAIALSVTSLVIPYVHAVTGDLFVTMMAFQVIRIGVIILINVLGFTDGIGIFLARITFGGSALIVINIIYTKLFGDFFDNLMQSGVAFSWPLFFFATIVIFGSYGVMYFFSDKEASYNFKAIKKRIKDLAEQSAKAKPKKEPKQKVKHPKQEHKIESKAIPEETIKNGCPKCKSDVQGNNRQGFHCSRCNKIYRRRELQLMRF